MATFGSGNLENETALDYLDEIIGEFYHKLVDCADEPENFESDEPSLDLFFVDLEVYTTLLEKFNYRPPELDEVLSWETTCFEVWEEYWQKNFPDNKDFYIPRRAVLKATFKKLKVYCKNYKK